MVDVEETVYNYLHIALKSVHADLSPAKEARICKNSNMPCPFVINKQSLKLTYLILCSTERRGEESLKAA